MNVGFDYTSQPSVTEARHIDRHQLAKVAAIQFSNTMEFCQRCPWARMAKAVGF
jgi:hypothetical protein